MACLSHWEKDRWQSSNDVAPRLLEQAFKLDPKETINILQDDLNQYQAALDDLKREVE